MKILKILPIFFILGIAFISEAAYPIETISLDPTRKDFVVGPGKQEFFLKPGESAEVEILVSNRMGEERVFELNTEDFVGSRKPEETVIFLENQRGLYSLKDFISFTENKFTLPNGTRARVPVRIQVPADAEPGGLYGSLMVSTVKPVEKGSTNQAQGGVPINLRSAVLFFVRVAGFVKEEGGLVEFNTVNNEKYFSANQNMRMQLVFENNGSVHLDPYGHISLTNFFGSEIKRVEVEPWFSMPDSLRSREVSLNLGNMIGRYTAVAKIYRGYGDIGDANSFDEKKLVIWVIPWLELSVLALIVFVFIASIRWLRRNFEFKRK